MKVPAGLGDGTYEDIKEPLPGFTRYIVFVRKSPTKSSPPPYVRPTGVGAGDGNELIILSAAAHALGGAAAPSRATTVNNTGMVYVAFFIRPDLAYRYF
jgi:hypothetical protein